MWFSWTFKFKLPNIEFRLWEHFCNLYLSDSLEETDQATIKKAINCNKCIYLSLFSKTALGFDIQLWTLLEFDVWTNWRAEGKASVVQDCVREFTKHMTFTISCTTLKTDICKQSCQSSKLHGPAAATIILHNGVQKDVWHFRKLNQQQTLPPPKWNLLKKWPLTFRVSLSVVKKWYNDTNWA